MLTENAFAVLGAMPGDNRRILNEKADEAALLGGSDAETALNQLMQMNRRIPAELGWFPASTADAAEDFLRYASTLSQGKRSKIPPLSGLGSAIAQANALSALFEIWPAEQTGMFTALCRAMDAILSQVTAEETLQAINADRTRGGWEVIPDTLTLLGPLNEHLRELCAPLARAIARLDLDAVGAALKELYGANGIDLQGVVAEAISDAYLIRIQEKADKLHDSLDGRMRDLETADTIALTTMNDLLSDAEQWSALTLPLRMKPGQMRNEAKKMGLDIRNTIANYFIKSKPEIGKIGNGNTVTGLDVFIFWKQTLDNALSLNKRLGEAFPEQAVLHTILEEDEKRLQQILKLKLASLTARK